MAQGLQAFQRGAFDVAVQHWQAAAASYAQTNQTLAQSKALTRLAQAYQALGQYRKAQSSLSTAYASAKRAGDQEQLAMILGGLGNVYIATGPPEKANRAFQQAMSIANALDHNGLKARISNDLGNYFTAQAKPQDALQAYRDSAQYARLAGLWHLSARAQINAATASLRIGRYAEATAQLQVAQRQLQKIAPSHQKAYDLNKIGLTYTELLPHAPQDRQVILLQAFSAFNEAATIAQELRDIQAEAYAWGYLGHLYEQQQRYREALHLTRRAATLVQRIQAPESLYRWQWQSGRLLRALGNHQDALAAYRNAISTLQSIRQELSHAYGKPYVPFRTSLGPLYFEFVDLLLQQAAAIETPRLSEPFLREARATVEQFKAAELRDYFQDDCVDMAETNQMPLDHFTKDAVIVYPILLPDRMELLVSLPARLKRYTVDVDATKLRRVVRRFIHALREDNARRYLRHAKRLYTWLITPFEEELAATPAKTLVFVPDEALRLIPMAALYDGHEFLIEKYAIATTPSLSLTDPKPLRRDNMQTLTAGLTEPRQGFAALPHVSYELDTIQDLYGGTQLLNQDFLVERMEQVLKTGDYSIVHIASHGQFASDADQSFILTFDDKLTMDQLEDLIGRLRYREEPIELLTLSACETAVGDDRAALGLAGIAIKAGARSALATLWRVEDEATAILITEFYRQLYQSSISRAQALRLAQLTLLRHVRYHSPFFWSPFLLINNWL